MEYSSFMVVVLFLLAIIVPHQITCQSTTSIAPSATVTSQITSPPTEVPATSTAPVESPTATTTTTTTTATMSIETASIDTKPATPLLQETSTTPLAVAPTSSSTISTSSIAAPSFPTTSTTTKTTVNPSTVAPVQYQRIDSSSYCENSGILFQLDSDMKCSCTDEYYGEKCENKVETIYLKLVFGLAILAGIMLLIALFLGCQWHKRLRDIESKEIEIKQMTAQKNQYRNQNRELRQRTPSPTRSNYATSVMTGQDDRKSMYGLNMPQFDSMSFTQGPPRDAAIKIDSDDELSGDELDSSKLRANKRQLDAISIGSGFSNAGSDRSLLRPTNRQQEKRNSWAGSVHEDERYDNNPSELRKPRSASQGNLFVDNRGYVKQSETPPRRSSPNHLQELSVENMRDFDSTNGRMNGQPGKTRSLMDLRVTALTSDKNSLGVVNGKIPKTKSTENISTGQVQKLAVRPDGAVDFKPTGKGIWARTQKQHIDDSANKPFTTSAF